MKEIKEIKELQKIELDILVYIDKICRENNLKYFLAYGTLIGAVRHNGFIPWDDDIDILMPRNDYEHFCNLLNEKQDNYRVLEWKTEKKYIYPFAKVIDTRTQLQENNIVCKSMLGVYVDVFPYDGYAGKSQIKWADLLAQMRKWTCLGFVSMRHNEKVWKNIPRRVLWMFLKLFGHRNLICLIEKNARRKTVEESNLCGCFGCADDNYKEIFRKKDIEKCSEMSFEGHYFYVPEGYDHLLRNMYGDYMELPPESQRVSNHDYQAWWI